MSTILKCRDCGYFLAETTAKDGALRLVCRRCRRSQLFRLAEMAAKPQPLTTAAA